MASVDGISPVDVCTDCITFTLIVSEYLGFMSTGVRPQYRISVYIVRISTTSAWMILGKAERIEILGDRDDRMKIVVVCICW